MKNNEKIILAVTAVLTYILYFKYKEKSKCPKCPECPSEQPTIIALPSINLPTPAPIPSVTTTPLDLEQALIYTGPEKFRVPAPEKGDLSVEWIYFVRDGKFFKFKMWSTKSVPDDYIEISKKEIIDAWNSVK